MTQAPTNIDEYIRMAQLATAMPAGWEAAVCAYDTDRDKLLEIFAVSDQGGDMAPYPMARHTRMHRIASHRIASRRNRNRNR